VHTGPKAWQRAVNTQHSCRVHVERCLSASHFKGSYCTNGTLVRTRLLVGGTSAPRAHCHWNPLPAQKPNALHNYAERQASIKRASLCASPPALAYYAISPLLEHSCTHSSSRVRWPELLPQHGEQAHKRCLGSAA